MESFDMELLVAGMIYSVLLCCRHPTLEGNVENQVGNSFFVLSIYGFDIEMSLKLKVTYCKFHSVEGFSFGTK